MKCPNCKEDCAYDNVLCQFQCLKCNWKYNGDIDLKYQEEKDNLIKILKEHFSEDDRYPSCSWNQLAIYILTDRKRPQSNIDYTKLTSLILEEMGKAKLGNFEWGWQDSSELAQVIITAHAKGEIC